MKQPGNRVNKLPFYLKTLKGNIFSLLVSPREIISNELVIFIPPFAEEMNKTRHMMFLTARQIAVCGRASLVFDFYGTGDSEGLFEETSIDIWYENIDKILKWATSKGYTNLTFIGIRLGALLLFDYLINKKPPSVNVRKLVLWQPVSDGSNYMTQFLRLRMAADFIASNEKVTTKSLIENLASGEVVEVAGYSLTGQLYSDIAKLKINNMIQKINYPVEWFEIVADKERPVGMATRKTIESDAWKTKPVLNKITGEQFWATPEISNNTQLIQASAKLAI